MNHYGMTKTAQLAIPRGLAENYRRYSRCRVCGTAGHDGVQGGAEFVGWLAAEKGIDRRAFEQEFFEKARP
jgi:hypothetical protein